MYRFCFYFQKCCCLFLALIVYPSVYIYGQPAGNRPLGKLVLELESHVQWVAVKDAWKTARDSWIINVEKGGGELSKGILLLESNLQPAVMEPQWLQRRQIWRAECATFARDPASLAKLLLEFEAHLKWEAVDEEWKSRRDAWIAEVGNCCLQTAINNVNDPNCTSVLGIVQEINTNGFKKWVGQKETSYLWGKPSQVRSDTLLFKHSLWFELALQKGYQQKILDDTWVKVKQTLDPCLTGWKTGKRSTNTDMVNGDNVWWEKEGVTLYLYFGINAGDYNDTHYLILTIDKKR